VGEGRKGERKRETRAGYPWQIRLCAFTAAWVCRNNFNYAPSSIYMSDRRDCSPSEAFGVPIHLDPCIASGYALN
jgi:hypothetical protein